MSESDVLAVRVYLHESKAHMEKLLKYLHDESKVRGVTVFRGITEHHRETRPYHLLAGNRQ